MYILTVVCVRSGSVITYIKSNSHVGLLVLSPFFEFRLELVIKTTCLGKKKR